MSNNNALDQLVNKFKDEMACDLKKVYCDDLPYEIYFRPANANERDAIIPLINSGNLFQAYAETVVQLSRDSDGVKMFKKHHTKELMRKVPSRILEAVATQMYDDLKDDDHYADEVVKKS